MTSDLSGVGLCRDCVHTRPVRSARGSTFLRCARHEHDPRFAKYPRLPVTACPGFERSAVTARDIEEPA